MFFIFLNMNLQEQISKLGAVLDLAKDEAIYHPEKALEITDYFIKLYNAAQRQKDPNAIMLRIFYKTALDIRRDLILPLSEI